MTKTQRTTGAEGTQAYKHFPLNANIQLASLFISHGLSSQLYYCFFLFGDSSNGTEEYY